MSEHKRPWGDLTDAIRELREERDELLEALKLCVARMPDPPENCLLKEEKAHDAMLTQAREAIAKAKGKDQ